MGATAHDSAHGTDDDRRPGKAWRPWRLLAAIGLIAAVGAAVFGGWIVYRLGHPTKGYRYLIPEGHVGWFVVEFGVPGAPSLPVQDGWHVVQVPVDGVVRTSERLIGGEAMSEPLYVQGGEYRGRATTRRGFTSQTWEAINSGSGRVDTYTFVGEPADAGAWTEKRDEKGNPFPGLRPRSMTTQPSPQGNGK